MRCLASLVSSSSRRLALGSENPRPSVTYLAKRGPENPLPYRSLLCSPLPLLLDEPSESSDRCLPIVSLLVSCSVDDGGLD